MVHFTSSTLKQTHAVRRDSARQQLRCSHPDFGPSSGVVEPASGISEDNKCLGHHGI